MSTLTPREAFERSIEHIFGIKPPARPVALLGWPRAGTRWVRLPEAEWPETMECPDCGGDGTIEGFEDRWSASSEMHYTVEMRDDCERCNTGGTVPLDNLSAAELLERGFRFDGDGNLWRMNP